MSDDERGGMLDDKALFVIHVSLTNNVLHVFTEKTTANSWPKLDNYF